jgi:tRNA-specific 2-thiouridylase
MSGGVDSSVAAALLKERGYDVTGVTLKTRNWDDSEGKKFGGCCGSSDFYDARAVAQALGIPHYNFDYVDTFRQTVIGYFKDSYKAGETPNPCIACNQHVKFDRLLAQAEALGADYLATGHYARIDHVDGGPHRLRKAVDANKDQSYVLYHLQQAQLAKLLFPVGEFAKPRIREIAHELKLKTADKPDSQEICFVPNNDYRQFVADEIPAEERPEGVLRHKDGRVLGRHQGLPFYTIGQRSGLGISVGRPLYVVAIEKATNTVVVGEKADVLAEALEIRDVSWVEGTAPALPAGVSVKIRYKHTEAAARLEPSLPHRVTALFDEPQSAMTPGQAAVFYDGDVVLGGGVIDHVIRQPEARIAQA